MCYRLYDPKVWRAFIYAAFEISDFFSLKNYCWCKDDYQCFFMIERLAYYRIDKGKSFPYSVWGDYTITYYECNYHTMNIMHDIKNIEEMRYPDYPEDISFYKNDKIWFESTTHEYDWRIVNTDPVFLDELDRRLTVHFRS